MASEFSSIASMADFMRFHAIHGPERIALDFEGRQTSFLQLEEASNQVANGLRRETHPSARVAILDKNSNRYLEVLAGTLKAETVIVPINSRLAPPEIAFILNNSGSEILFVGNNFVETIKTIRDQIGSVRRIIVLDREYDEWRDAQSKFVPGRSAGDDETFAQLYTSGTTGNPKGVQLTDAGFITATSRLLRVFGNCSPEKNALLILPLFHVTGLQFALTAWRAGMKIVVLRDFDARRILEIIERDRIHVSFLVPTMLQDLVVESRKRDFDVSTLEGVVYGASPMPIELLKAAAIQFKDTSFIHAYGMTETTGTITAVPSGPKVAESVLLKSCGKPLDGVEIRIVSPAGSDLPVGQVGEIICRSSTNMKCYWNLLEESMKTLRDGWLHTGDAGYVDSEGYLYISDRVKDMIISGGENIYPAEVENVLYGHPDVAEAAIIGVPDERWGESVKAVIVLKSNTVPDSNAILSYTRQFLAGFKVPKTIEFVEVLPRSSSGKVLKRELRKRYAVAPAEAPCSDPGSSGHDRT
jgi:fatty-acyl-CoA synthase